MGLRCFCVLTFLISITPGAFASEQAVAANRASCSTVRYYVAKFGATIAEQWARSSGMSEAQINTARRCLKGVPMRTAETNQS